MTSAFPCRCLNARDAARYCGVSVKVLRKHGPKPIRIGIAPVFDRQTLDSWLDRLAGIPGTGADSDAERAMLAAIKG